MTPFNVLIIMSIIFIVLRLNFGKGKTMHKVQPIEVSQPQMLTIQEFVKKYNSYKGTIKGGTVCFWGYWFGKPYDNFHQIAFVGFDETEQKLELLFTESESLIIEFPEGIKEYSNRIEIESAKKILWQWHPYGKPYNNTPEDYSYIEIIRNDGSIEGKSEDNWREDAFKRLDINKPAVLIT